MNIPLLKMGLALLVGFLFGGYHFDDQTKIPDGLPKHHTVRLPASSICRVFLIFRDKNNRRYFSVVAVALQLSAYILALANFLLAISVRSPTIADAVLRADYGLALLGLCIIVFFCVFYRQKCG